MRKLLQLLLALILSAGILFGQWWYVPSPIVRQKGFTEDDFNRFRNNERQQRIDIRNARIARAVLTSCGFRREDVSFYIARNVRHNSLPPRLVAAVIVVESSCNPEAVSPSGAVGLMQINTHVWKIKDPQNPEENIRRGVSILARYISEAGNIPGGLQLYSGGTEGYAEKVLNIAYGGRR
jgi:soluble lytic murein transglycosylase-like protein